MSTYSVRFWDGNAEETTQIEAETPDAAEQIAAAKAVDWIKGGDWPTDETTYLDVSWELTDEDGEQVAEGREAVTIEAVEPKCRSKEGHDWQAPVEIVGGIKDNPGVFGHGGGVKIHECCMRCGCSKVVDTWAQHPQTGRQGLRSVEYDRDGYVDELQAYRAAHADAHVEV